MIPRGNLDSWFGNRLQRFMKKGENEHIVVCACSWVFLCHTHVSVCQFKDAIVCFGEGLSFFSEITSFQCFGVLKCPFFGKMICGRGN